MRISQLVAKDDELGRKLQDLDFACKRLRAQEGPGVDKKKRFFVLLIFSLITKRNYRVQSVNMKDEERIFLF